MNLLVLAVLLAAAEPEKQPAPEEPKRVVYIPESVKAEIKEQIRKEVLEQAKQEGWAAPNQVPEWVKRFKLNGDVRARFERDLFPRGNASTGEFPDFNAINTGKPFDVNFVDPSNERYLNVDQNRTRPRLRARLGVDAEVTQSFTAGVRIATGSDPNPGSENQTLGNMFSKYQVWFDRAFVRWAPSPLLSVRFGRFENPFFTTELIWSPEVNFDGAVIEARGDPSRPVAPFAVAGAFPLYNSAFAFAPEQTSKFFSRNKWLYAGQAGADFALGSVARVRLGAAFYFFDKLEGRTSGPCDTNLSFVTCDADESRPSFAQKGNTYFAIRTPSPAALLLESSSAVPRYQFFGLASRFREIAVTGRFSVSITPAVLAEAEADYVHNAGFNSHEISGSALNNRGAISGDEVIGPYRGGPDAVLGRAGVGSPTQARQWDWKLRVGYRYIQSDAVVDAFNDQDFGLGGTNLKGLAADGTLFVADGVSFTVRWFSADQIVGPTYRADVFQLDLLARF